MTTRPGALALFGAFAALLAAGPLVSEEAGARLVVNVGHSFMIKAIAFSPDGTLLASASGDETARLWEVATGREIHVLKGHGSHVSAVAFSPDGKTLASGSWDMTVKLWDPATRREVRKLRGN